MTNETYTLSDLAGAKRTQLVEDARHGRARVRDKDGQNLVMLREQRLNVLEEFATWSQTQQRLRALADREQMPPIAELGDLAWVRVFDRADLAEFADELLGAVLAALSDQNSALVDEVVSAWRTTARQLEDPLRRSILLGELDDSAYENAEQPHA